MNETDNFQHSMTHNCQYEEYFMNVQYNGNVLTDDERRDFIRLNDETISVYEEGLPMLKESIDSLKGKDDALYNAYRTILTVAQFAIITSIDCMVISKYFLLADTDYDKRFMRGKMRVILNEGFKKLYGFNESSKKKSEWRKLDDVMEYFPLSYQLEYQKLTFLLDRHSKTSSWWKEERDLETHLDAQGLYDSRCEEIVESKVMMDSTKLFCTLYAIQLFTTNVHAWFYNTIVKNYLEQEARKAPDA